MKIYNVACNQGGDDFSGLQIYIFSTYFHQNWKGCSKIPKFNKASGLYNLKCFI
jgi:hypothetical protein